MENKKKEDKRDIEDRKCEFCPFSAKSRSGLQNHIHRKHSIENSGLQCWTCGKQFTKQELIDQHYKTVLHQINCKKVENEDRSEKPTETIENIIREYQEKREKKRKRSKEYKLQETSGSNPFQKIRRRDKTPVKFLRTDPAIIPLENTMPQADPRTEVIISWTDVSELEIEEFYNKNLKQVPITLPEETHETAKERAFREEIIELFNIPKEDIPSTSSSQKLLEETTVLDLRDVLADVTEEEQANVTATSQDIQENLNFLDFLKDSSIL